MGILELKNVNEHIDKSLDLIDDVWEGQDEAQEQSTRRLELDMSSKFILPHIIRPIITLWAMTLYSYLAIYAIHNELVDTWIVLAATGTILTSAVGFYFRNKTLEKKHVATLMSQEKTAELKIKAAVKIEQMKTRADIVVERKAERKAKKLERIEARND